MSSLLPQLQSPSIAGMSQTRPCSRCRRLMPPTQTGKSCSACRVKVKSQRDKRRDMERALNLSGDRRDKNNENAVEKFPEIPYDLANLKFKKPFKDTPVAVKNTDNSSSRVFECPEYQTSGALFANLSSHRNLKATYSIVSTAKPPMTLEGRVVLVTRALRAELEKNKGGLNRAHPLLIFSTSTSHSRRYACKCGKGPLKPQNTSSASTIPLKRTTSDISRYFGVKNSSSKENEQRPCGGEIEVMVEEDSSHWLEIKAHRVTIQIEHKGRYA